MVTNMNHHYLKFFFFAMVHGHLGQWVVTTSTEKFGLIDPEGNLAPWPTIKA